MKGIAAVAILAVTADAADRAAMVKELQNTPGILWKAELDPRFENEPIGKSKVLAGVKPEAMAKRAAFGALVAQKVQDTTEIPENFDSITNWPQCAKVIGDILDQSNCGCCWAFAAATASSSRLCIATNASTQVPLSPQDICFCSSDDGCDGGQIDAPWDYIGASGVVTGGQYKNTGPFGKGMCSDFSLPHCHHHGPQRDDPYPAEGQPGCPSESSPQCPKTCDSDSDREFAKDKWSFSGGTRSASGEAEIARAIMEGGPVETAFTVFEDFANYASGIYHHVSGGVEGGHAVTIVGWGVEDGHKYWKVQNSWNPYWGERGYFRIIRGSNHCGIEDQVTFSAPGAKWSQGSSEIVV